MADRDQAKGNELSQQELAAQQAEELPDRDAMQLLDLAERLGNVAEACRRMGYSRDSFYRFRRRYAQHGLEGLLLSHRGHGRGGRRFTAEVEQAIVRMSLRHPKWGQEPIAAALRERGIRVSASGVRKFWTRAALETAAKRSAAAKKAGR